MKKYKGIKMNENTNKSNKYKEEYENDYDYFKLKTVHEIMKNKYEYYEDLFKIIDEKSNNFLNISILMLTIEVSFLASGISNFLTNMDIIVNLKILFLFVYLGNIFFNMLSIYLLYKSYEISEYQASLDSKTIYDYYFEDEKEKGNDEKGILNEGISSMHEVNKNNREKIKEKTDFVKSGSICLLISVFLLILSIFTYLIIMVK